VDAAQADEMFDQVVEEAAGLTSEEEASDGVVRKTDETAEGEETAAKAAADPNEEDLPPFHEHPRWKQVNTERETLRVELDQAKPIVEKYRVVDEYRQRYGISDEQFNQAVEMAALLIHDPETARERLRPLVGSLDAFVGETLPDDLDIEVKDGTLSQARAKEIAKLRAQDKVKETRGKLQAEGAQRAAQAAVVNALNAWDLGKRKTDPDFKPATNGAAGKYELVHKLATAALLTRQVSDAASAVVLAEAAYEEANQLWKRSVTPKPPKKVLSSTGSAATKVQEPKTVEEAMEMVIAQQR
jgi:ribosome-binding protein aMBF1 (putative translation factor)